MNRNQLMIDKVHSAMLDNWTIIIESSLMSWGFIWFGTVHSDRIFGHEMHFSTICPKTAECPEIFG